MDHICCVTGIDPAKAVLLYAALQAAGEPSMSVLRQLDVADLSRRSPHVLVCDLDRLDVDPLELLRQVRFVLPECTIVVYTAIATQAWARECHLAGASCVLSTESNEAQLTAGLRRAIQSGCFTDPRLGASA